MNMDIDIDLLIGEVEKRRVIWDTLSEEYKNRNKKQEAWILVCRCLFENFDEKLQSEQQLALNEVMAKWKTVRGNFTRSLKKRAESQKSGSGKKRISHYTIYEDQLRFLLKSREVRETQNSNDYQSINRVEESNSSMNLNTSIEVRQNTVSQNVQAPPTSAIHNKKKKKIDVEEQLVAFMSARSNTHENNDEDLSFFLYLLPAVKTLRDVDKLQFRIKVMQLLQKLKKKNVIQTLRNDYSEQNLRCSHNNRNQQNELSTVSSIASLYFDQFQ
ncbi:hypothetical protein ABEB36_014002 [Hypothenemus hampei]|uniref:MADF domain-containing protein n=1 Tax=Hypothenemus hampei TaxID=57062 RepID=A0ABD1E303_HYPHA